MAGNKDGQPGVTESGRAIESPPLDGRHVGTGEVTRMISIDELAVDPANLRKRDQRANAGLEASLQRFGPARSIVVDGNGVVRAGNGTLEAARRAGITDVLLVEPEPGQLVAVRRSDWSASEATGYSIADNRLSDLSQFDIDGLSQTLRALESEEFDLSMIGFTDEEVDGLFGRRADEGGEVVDDPQAEWQGMPEFQHEDLTPFRTLHVHFRNAEDVQHFGMLISQVIGEKAKFLWHPEQQRISFEKMRYVNESEIPDLHTIQGSMGEADHGKDT